MNILKQKFDISQGGKIFKDSLLSVWNTPTARWITIGSALRAFSGMSESVYFPLFFLKNFPNYKNEYSLFNAAALSILGFTSSILGGIINDKFAKKNPKIITYNCIASSIICLPISAMVCLTTDNFWVSFSFLALKILLTSSWQPGTYTML